MRISWEYWVSLISWAFFSAFFFKANKTYTWLTVEDTNLILSAITVAITIFSIGLANRKKPKFRGTISCWLIESKKQTVNNDRINPIGEYSCVTFSINNLNKEAVRDLVINFRLPSIIVHRCNIESSIFQTYNFKDTLLLTAKDIPFLGSDKGDCTIVFELFLNLDKWSSQGGIHVTVAGSNITPTTRTMNYILLDKLKKTNSKNPYFL